MCKPINVFHQCLDHGCRAVVLAFELFDPGRDILISFDQLASSYEAGDDDLEHHARSHGFEDQTALTMAVHFVHMGAMLFPVRAAE